MLESQRPLIVTQLSPEKITLISVIDNRIIIMNKFIRFSVLLPACASAAFAQAAPSVTKDGFDKPLQVQTKRLKLAPWYPGRETVVSCYRYPGYMVKQLDSGEKGAGLSILPIAADAVMSCSQSKEVGEYDVSTQPWGGYFAGVKSGYAFFDSADSFNSGQDFIVVRMEDKKIIFRDVKEDLFHSIDLRGGVPSLRYRRGYAASCSVLAEGDRCADAIARETGVSKASLAICAQGYKEAAEWAERTNCKWHSKNFGKCVKEAMARLDKHMFDAETSVIRYEVEIDLREAATKDAPISTAKIKLLSNALECRPAG